MDGVGQRSETVANCKRLRQILTDWAARHSPPRFRVWTSLVGSLSTPQVSWMKMCLSSAHLTVPIFSTPWTVACEAPSTASSTRKHFAKDSPALLLVGLGILHLIFKYLQCYSNIEEGRLFIRSIRNFTSGNIWKQSETPEISWAIVDRPTLPNSESQAFKSFLQRCCCLTESHQSLGFVAVFHNGCLAAAGWPDHIVAS